MLIRVSIFILVDQQSFANHFLILRSSKLQITSYLEKGLKIVRFRVFLWFTRYCLQLDHTQSNYVTIALHVVKSRFSVGKNTGYQCRSLITSLTVDKLNNNKFSRH